MERRRGVDGAGAVRRRGGRQLRDRPVKDVELLRRDAPEAPNLLKICVFRQRERG